MKNRRQVRRAMIRGNVSPRVVKRRLVNEKATAAAAQLTQADGDGLEQIPGAVSANHAGIGAMPSNHINRNRNSRTWPAASAISSANNTRPRRQAPIPNYGNQYSGRNSRP